jgi:hypothetical protein
MKLDVFKRNFRLFCVILLVNGLFHLAIVNFPEAFQASDVLPYQLWVNVIFIFVFLLPNRVAQGIL